MAALCNRVLPQPPGFAAVYVVGDIPGGFFAGVFPGGAAGLAGQRFGVIIAQQKRPPAPAQHKGGVGEIGQNLPLAAGKVDTAELAADRSVVFIKRIRQAIDGFAVGEEIGFVKPEFFAESAEVLAAAPAQIQCGPGPQQRLAVQHINASVVVPGHGGRAIGCVVRAAVGRAGDTPLAGGKVGDAQAPDLAINIFDFKVCLFVCALQPPQRRFGRFGNRCARLCRFRLGGGFGAAGRASRALAARRTPGQQRRQHPGPQPGRHPLPFAHKNCLLIK